jgi:hypothetical protein
VKLRFWGSNPDADQKLISNLTAIALKAKVAISVEYVDVLANIDRASTAHILVTPTLERLEPLPALRLIAIPVDLAGVLKALKA